MFSCTMLYCYFACVWLDPSRNLKMLQYVDWKFCVRLARFEKQFNMISAQHSRNNGKN